MAVDSVDTGRTYGSSRPVVVRVHRRDGKLTIDDDGAAIDLAGRPPGWLERAERIAESAGVNVNRRGIIFVPAFHESQVEHLVVLIAGTSLQVYDTLLDEE
jgi:hypothetical protein